MLRFTRVLERLEKSVIDTLGRSPVNLRQAAARGGEVPADLTQYLDKVRRHAYRVVDGDVERLKAAGYSEDQIFELTLAAAVGEARRQLDMARQVLEAAGVAIPRE